jgi:YfiH family protein
MQRGALEAHGALRLWRPSGCAAWPWLRLGVTTRRGGHSAPPYDTLNLGLSTGDRVEDVRANRALLRRSLQLDGRSWSQVRQVHGCRVVEARRCDAGPTRADGLWTADPQRVLAVGVADCTPVFIWDARRRAVALVHAGWRGTAAGIVRVAVQALCDAGARRPDLWFALGPSIGACCYEVGPEVREVLPEAVVSSRERGTHVDLRHANRLQALDCGIPEAHLLADPPCTGCTTELFFSHRKQGPRTGRQWALMWMAA